MKPSQRVPTPRRLALALIVLAVLVTGSALALASPRASAQEAPEADAGPINVAVDVAPAVVTLGDPVRVTITVTHTEDILVTATEPARREFQVLAATLVPVTRPGSAPGTLVTEFAYTIAAFNLGQLQPGEIEVAWLRADGATGSVTASTAPFEVRTTVAGGATDIRPLKPQQEVGGAPLAWQRPALAGGAVVVVMLGGLAIAWVLRRRGSAVSMPPVDGPERASRRRLEELAAADPLGAGDYDGYYGTIASVVRSHLAKRFDFPATAWTTTELERRMVAVGVERWQARLVSGLLDRCDRAVFAGRYPDAASADHDLTVAFEIIELSRGREPDAAAPAPAAAGPS